MYTLSLKYILIYIYIYIYIDIVPDVPDTSSESKNNIGPPSGGLKKNSITVLSVEPCVQVSLVQVHAR